MGLALPQRCDRVVHVLYELTRRTCTRLNVSSTAAASAMVLTLLHKLRALRLLLQCVWMLSRCKAVLTMLAAPMQQRVPFESTPEGV